MSRRTAIGGRHIAHALGAALGVALCATLSLGQTAIRDREMYPLPLGEKVERNVKSGDHHTYPVELKTGQVLRLDARGQRASFSLILWKLDDDSAVAMSADGFGRSTLTYIAKEAGRYGVELSAHTYTTANSSYQLTAVVDQATDRDGERVKAEEILILGGLINNRGDEGGLRAVAERLEESLELWRKLKEPYWESVARHYLGLTHYHLDELGQAAEHFAQAVILCQAENDRHGGAWSLSHLGLVYLAMDETEQALEYMEMANGVFAEVGDARGAMLTFSNIGLIYMEMGNPERAIEYFKRILEVAREFGDSKSEAALLANIGKAYGALRDARQELNYTQQALEKFRAIDDYGGEAATRNNIGGAYQKLGETRKAFENYHRALPLYKAEAHKRREALTFNNLMEAARGLHGPRLAIFYGKQAVNIYQELRGASAGLDKETQQTYLKSVERTYRNLSELLIEQGRLAEALQLLNSFKDQQFFDFDPSARKEPVPLSLTPREALFAERYRQASERAGLSDARFRTLRSEIESGVADAEEAAQINKLEAESKTADAEFLSLLGQAESEFSRPPSDADRVAEVSDLREMQATLRTLHQSTGRRSVAIYTLVGEKTYRALIVTPDGVAEASKPLKGAELNGRAQQLWALLQRAKYDPRVVARNLYDSVFRPVEAKLPPGTDTLLWSLDGNLRYVPMAALYDGKRYLVERYQNVVFTRADRERMTRPVSPRWTGVGLGSSEGHEVSLLGETISFMPLPGVEAELAAIFRTQETPGGLLDGEVRRNGSFNRASMLAALGRRRPLVHIASHFSFRPGDEARSFLLLGDGSVLTLSEMKKEDGLFAGAELLTLSACNTAAQRVGANGREIDGFAEMAQRLGAAAVLATLWSVADNSTPSLMTDFYRRRETAARPTKAAALRQAQLALLKGQSAARPMPLPADADGAGRSSLVIVKRGGDAQTRQGVRAEVVYVAEEDAPLFKRDDMRPFAHPYYWAPFILVGNWR